MCICVEWMYIFDKTYVAVINGITIRIGTLSKGSYSFQVCASVLSLVHLDDDNDERIQAHLVGM